MQQAANTELDIAVVGIAGRFSQAPSVAEFWRTLREGRNATERLTDAELVAAGVPDQLRLDPDYVPVWSGLPDADLFDAEFFGYSPAEAELLDPQQRVFLETAWQAIEDAGLDPSRVADVAVYAATGINRYLFEQLLPDTGLVRTAGSFALAVSNDKDNLSTRVSYKLGLTGPSFTVQSNCSSGMVALHLAVSGLLDGQSDAALVGSVSIKSRTRRGYLAEAGGISSPGGVIRAFDAEADGYFIGDGAAALVLKRYDDAVRDGDRVYAVVKGTAVNNDGSAKAGFTAPSKQGQVSVIRAALAMADVKPETVGYIEANGSGTRLGDAIEVAALREAYARSGVDADLQLIGSVKPNFGNLDASSGTASLLKAVLALHHGEIPPSINYEQPNPETDLADGPIRVNDVLRSWPAGPDDVRRAGVSSFGVGGTNVHAILEEAPTRPALPNEPGWHLILVSARTADALRDSCRRLAAHLERHTEQSLADVAFTSQLGRKAFEHRTFVVAERRGAAVRALQTAAARAVHERAAQPPVVRLTELADLDPTDAAYAEELTRLGQAWQSGASVAWSALHPANGRHRVGLPSYPFQRRSFWHTPDGSTAPEPAEPQSVATPTVRVGEPASDRPSTVTAEYEAPVGLIEEAVAGIWRRRLGLQRIGRFDSFLELGGDSLVAARIANEMAGAFHVQPNLRAFLESPTIAAMAVLVDEQLAQGEQLRTLVAQAADAGGPA